MTEELKEHPSMPMRRMQCEINGHFTGPVSDSDPRPLICFVCGDMILDESIPRHRGDRVMAPFDWESFSDDDSEDPE